MTPGDVDIATTLARFLAERGVRRAFGLPGTETIELMEAMRVAGIEFVLTHHESTAAFAATLTGHLTGVPGVCVVAGGPGIANATTGILAAHLDRMPLCVVIGDHVAAPDLPLHQRLPFEHVAPGIVRARLRAEPDTFADRLPDMFAAATGPVPGPVLISVTTEAVSQRAALPSGRTRAPADPDLDLAEVLALVVARLEQANRPLIAIGIGVTHSGGSDRLVRLAERLGAPVIDTPQSKGWFPNDHRLYLGTIATRRNREIVELAGTADVILGLGLDSAELLGSWPVQVPLVSIAPVPGDAAIPSVIVADAPMEAALDLLLERLPARDGVPQQDIDQCRSAIRDGLWPPSTEQPMSGMWPQVAVRLLQEELDPAAVVTTDVGSHKLLMVQQWVARSPNSFLCSTGLSPMGTGLGFAIGARLAMPAGRPLAAVIGDGGFLMYAGEMATLRRLPGPFVLVVLRDGALSSIRVKQARRGYAATGTLLGDVRVADVARAFDVDAIAVNSADSYRDAIRVACGSDRPMVIEAVVDPRGYEWSQ